jgi:hypothetical protein
MSDEPLDLEAIKARAEAATEGPWDWGPLDMTKSGKFALRAPGMRPIVKAASADVWPSAADADFIAAARSDIPALVAEVERLWADLAECQQHNDRTCIANQAAEQWAEQLTEATAEVERLTQENARLRAEKNNAVLNAAELIVDHGMSPAERDVIEAAKPVAEVLRLNVRAIFGTAAAAGERFIAAVDALDGTPEAAVDVVLPDGSHLYWSTHCRHGRHDACAATELAPGVPRQPSQCKTCAAPCICSCHREVVRETG